MPIEPGYYADGKFGIRIENLIVVREVKSGFWGFENLTMCPYDRNLIERSLLSEEHLKHINAYHQEVLTKLTPLLSEPLAL